MAQGVSFPLYIGIGAKLRTVYTYKIIILYYIILLLYTSRSVYVVENTRVISLSVFFLAAETWV